MGMDLKSIGLPQGFIRIINNHPRYFSNVKTNTTLQAVYRINNIMMTSLEQKENYLNRLMELSKEGVFSQDEVKSYNEKTMIFERKVKNSDDIWVSIEIRIHGTIIDIKIEMDNESLASIIRSHEGEKGWEEVKNVMMSSLIQELLTNEINRIILADPCQQTDNNIDDIEK